MNHNKTVEAMLYLVRCALHNTPAQPLDQIDYEQLYKLSAFHLIEAMVAMALESGGLLKEDYAAPACIKQWKEAKVKAIRKVALLDAEREEIFRHFEEQGIWYLPLKGILLKELYPKLGMRQMADNDILFDKAYQHELKAYMESRGYQTDSFQRSKHDVYLKKPIYNFQFHTTLFESNSSSRHAMPAVNFEIRRQKDPENGFGYHFSDEDFYIYFLLHAYNHYQHGSIGIRLLTDVFLFLAEKQQSLDWEYVSSELTALDLQTFEANVRTLSQKLFDKDSVIPQTEAEEKLLGDLLFYGAYGTVSSRTQNTLRSIQEEQNLTPGKAKLYYFWKRVFPGRESILIRYPICQKHPWCIPFCWLLRVISAVALSGKRTWNELMVFRKTK